MFVAEVDGLDGEKINRCGSRFSTLLGCWCASGLQSFFKFVLFHSDFRKNKARFLLCENLDFSLVLDFIEPAIAI